MNFTEWGNSTIHLKHFYFWKNSHLQWKIQTERFLQL